MGLFPSMEVAQDPTESTAEYDFRGGPRPPTPRLACQRDSSGAGPEQRVIPAARSTRLSKSPMLKGNSEKSVVIFETLVCSTIQNLLLENTDFNNKSQMYSTLLFFR